MGLILFAIAILAMFAAVAHGLGVDSRDFSDDPRRSRYPVGIG